MFYTIDIAGMTRELKLFPVSDDTRIAAFILFGDVEMTEHAAKELLKRAPQFDLILTAEAKSITLAYEMARQAGMNDFIIARKGIKVYMEDVLSVNVRSITTGHYQTLHLGSDEVRRIKGKRVLVIDDVISTGDSLRAMRELVQEAGGEPVGNMAVLAEGDSYDREDIIALAKLPLFDKDGNPKA